MAPGTGIAEVREGLRQASVHTFGSWPVFEFTVDEVDASAAAVVGVSCPARFMRAFGGWLEYAAVMCDLKVAARL